MGVLGGSYSGRVLLDAKELDSQALRAVCSFHETGSPTFPHLSLMQGLMFEASIFYGKRAAQAIVPSIIRILQLEGCADLILDAKTTGGLSDGQRRRYAIGLQHVLSGQPFLFLDEPTTGLSAIDALQVCRLLRRLSSELGYGIIVSIHQPRSSVFDLLDCVLLLHRGAVAYRGPPSQVRSFFASVQRPLDPRSPAADSMLDVVQADTTDYLAQSFRTRPQLQAVQALEIASNPMAPLRRTPTWLQRRATTLKQLRVTMMRSLAGELNSKRLLVEMLIPFFFGFFTGLAWLGLGARGTADTLWPLSNLWLFSAIVVCYSSIIHAVSRWEEKRHLLAQVAALQIPSYVALLVTVVLETTHCVLTLLCFTLPIFWMALRPSWVYPAP
jgi:ABC-type multidrug transport system ATPase subunit